MRRGVKGSRVGLRQRDLRQSLVQVAEVPRDVVDAGLQASEAGHDQVKLEKNRTCVSKQL